MGDEVGLEVGMLPFGIGGLLVWVAKLALKLGRRPLELGGCWCEWLSWQALPFEV